MRRRLRLGRHQLDIAVDATKGEPVQADEQVPEGEVVFSRTWNFGNLPSADEVAAREDAAEAERQVPIDVVAADPFAIRNLLLVPSALLVGLGAFFGDDSGWFWILALLGLAGIGAFEVLRRRDKKQRERLQELRRHS